MGLLDGTTQQEYYNSNDFGNYQFVSLEDIINQFMIVYVGEGKIIPKAKRLDVAFHAQRALAELSFDTFKSFKAQEITVPATLQMVLPQDYVNYTKISWVDSAGIKHLLYPTSKTSNPKSFQQDSNGDYLFSNEDLIESGNLIVNGGFNGVNNWALNIEGANQNALATTINTNTTTGTVPVTTTVPATSVAWIYGFDGYAVGAYNLPEDYAIAQQDVSLSSQTNYTVTYTVSNYTSGGFRFTAVDQNGDFYTGTTRSANGTFTETFLLGDPAGGVGQGGYPPRTFWIESVGTSTNGVIDGVSIVKVGNENINTTTANYKSGTPPENQDDYQDDIYWPMEGSRYGLDPQHAQANGSFYIDQVSGKIHFSSNISGKTVILDYISDSLGTDGEMQVHKFAEEAMYKWISHAILAGKANIPEYQVNRFKKERFAAIRTAKLRLSNLKLEELTQILRGKSKQIKH